MKRVGWGDQIRGLQNFDNVHVHTEGGWRERDGMIRWEVAFKQVTKFTYFLQTDEEDGMIRWEVFKQLTKSTYFLETDEEDGMGWSDERSSNSWPRSRTSWRQTKEDGMGWSNEVLKQLTKFTYKLETDELRWLNASEGYSKNCQVHIRTEDAWRE